MSIWRLFDGFAVSDQADVINKVDENTFVTSTGKVFTRIGDNITGSDGSMYHVMDSQAGQGGSGFGVAVKTSHGFDRDDDGL